MIGLPTGTRVTVAAEGPLRFFPALRISLAAAGHPAAYKSIRSACYAAVIERRPRSDADTMRVIRDALSPLGITVLPGPLCL